ncbi:coiled-coil domain-containing protein R3HCC1L [Coregonus clupeaformis]|uniref:coiled-coil domain-containing protein R3HCC1L n=1 Tax=Coregonus clupeaformis TaxID=59861 RepID=UPI001E1C6499|nr:coiled-coil domain-containing protein R3HCC1L [Coregonus clupeaformis]XP_041696896.2 coiled-coil domain-containing protein R3HCC1L [Coregonus clupeaformis]
MVMEGEQTQEDSTQPQPPVSCSKKPDKSLYQPKKKQDGPKDKAQTQGDGKPKPRPRYTDKARKNAKNKKDKGGKTGGEGNGVLNGEAKLEERVEGGGEKGPQNDGQAATANQEGDGVVGSRLEGGSESSPEREGGSREGIEEGLQEEEEEEESWDALFDDEGECLDPHVLEELAIKQGRKKRPVQEARFDYYSLDQDGEGDGDTELREDELSNIIEIYDFPTEFKTEDLVKSFQAYQQRGFDIQFVDDTHALALFNSPIAAREALRTKHPLLKVRSLAKASVTTRAKARSCSDYLLPTKERPQTSAVLARRLVMGALGVKSPQSKEHREAEKKKLQDAREQKRLAAKQRDDAWEGKA